MRVEIKNVEGPNISKYYSIDFEVTIEDSVYSGSLVIAEDYDSNSDSTAYDVSEITWDVEPNNAKSLEKKIAEELLYQFLESKK